MAYPRSPDSNERAGIQAACDRYNADHGDNLTLTQYWDFVLVQARANNPDESAANIFARATESYQEQYDAGLGREAIRALRATR